MPAIDPERLQRQSEELRQLMAEPERLVRRASDLLDFYADRTRRPSATSEIADTTWLLGVPRPVLRAFGRALSEGAQRYPLGSRQAADLLWDAGYREARRLACAILSGETSAWIGDWVEDRTLTCDDPPALTPLAEEGLLGWRGAHPAEFLERCRSWLESSSGRLQLLAVKALQAAVDDPAFNGLPKLFRTLDGQLGHLHGQSRRVVAELIEALARRSAPEAARFLLDQLASDQPGSASLIRSSLAAFPPSQASHLRRALSR
jgi:hypothetical protein